MSKKLKMNDYKQGQNICTLLRLYEDLFNFIICPKVLVIGPFHFLLPNIFSNWFGSLVRSLFGLFGRK